jgi:heat-inducible transcriptional repressor
MILSAYFSTLEQRVLKNNEKMAMKELNDRQKLILGLVIHEYVGNAQPVGSQNLVDHYQLDISPATVRNVMVDLTEAGYLHQPHTSAGRAPTEEGYRYFVRQLMGQTDLPLNTRRTITHQFYQAGQDVNRWLRLAASVLASQSQAASLVTRMRPDQAHFKHLELIATHGRQVLMVLVLTEGEVRQQMLSLAEPVPQDRLSATATRLNHLCEGLNSEEISHIQSQSDALEQDLLKLVRDDLQRVERSVTSEVFRDGLTHVLAEPEFAEPQAARKALRVLEEPPFLEDLLNRTVLNAGGEGVQVLIGGEGTWQELRDCSMVLARYGAPGQLTGAIGVIGPMRMPYGRSVSAVRFVSGLLSDLVVEMLND